MTCKVLSTIQKNRLLDGVSSVCAGVSGGADSVAMLFILQELQPQFGYTLQAVHVNHLIRGEEAFRDAAFVRSLCESLSIPCKIIEIDVPALAEQQKLSLETCARKVRYEAFAAQRCDAIAVAHTLSDCIETSLFHLARGTSLRGACGIPVKNGAVIRPLLDCTREEVEAFVREKNLSFVTDSTNFSDKYTRNYIRHQLVPLFQVRFPPFEKNYSRFLAQAALTQSFLEDEARALLKNAERANGFDCSVLCESHPAVLQTAVQLLLADEMKKPVEYEHIRLCCAALSAGGKVKLGTDLTFVVGQGRAYFMRAQPFEWALPDIQLQQRLQTPFGVYQIRLYSGNERFAFDRRHWIDPQKAQGTLMLRERRAGDRFSSPVRKQTKTLKKLFNEMKLTLPERAAAAVLTSNNRLVWVEHVGVCAPFQASENQDPIWIVEKERNANTQ